MITFGGIKNKHQSMDTTAVYLTVCLMQGTLIEMELTEYLQVIKNK